MVHIHHSWKVGFFALLLLLIPVISQADTKAKLITIYAYHLKPPYIIDLESESGLYFDLVNYLNQKNPKLQFHLSYLPRKRLDIYLKRKQLNGFIMGVNPAWFKDKAKEKYLWTSTLFDDRDDIISNIKTPIEYQGPKSLYGKSIGGVLGYYYFGINEAVSEGKIKREDANSEKSLLEMIMRERVSAGIISNATYNYLVDKQGWQGKFHLSQEPHDLYTRHILVPRELENLFPPLLSITENMLSEPKWRSILDKYRINY